MHESPNARIESLAALAEDAGTRILAIRGEGAEVELKHDRSPVTRADREAEALILDGLDRLMTDGVLPRVPVVAEERVAAEGAPRVGGAFMLVDALDGTREFVRGGSDFTVNIALVSAGTPVLGVVCQPATGRLLAAEGDVAWARSREKGPAPGLAPLPRRHAPAEPPRIVASRSHRTPETDAFIAAISDRHGAAAPSGCPVVSVGSSLKFCLLALDEADLYPCLGRTMEWDTAAGDAILRAVGGTSVTLDGRPLRYGKRPADDAPFANPSFVAAVGAPPLPG